jgi:hypothetical protein
MNDWRLTSVQGPILARGRPLCLSSLSNFQKNIIRKGRDSFHVCRNELDKLCILGQQAKTPWNQRGDWGPTR